MEEKILKELANILSVKDQDSKEQLAHAIDSAGNPATVNSRPVYNWDVRYTKIRNVAIRNGMDFVTISRGSLWELVALVDEKNEEISLFLSEKNLQKIRKEKSPTHYMSILSVLNKEEALQTSLDLGDSSEVGLTEELFIKMMNDYEITAKKTYVYTFSDTYGQEQFSMYRFTSNYDLIEFENYSDLIDSTFEVDTTDKVKNDSTESTIVDKLKKQEKQIVSLKNN